MRHARSLLWGPLRCRSRESSAFQKSRRFRSMVMEIADLPMEMRTPSTGISAAGGGVLSGLRTAPKMPTTSRRMLLDSLAMDAQTGMKRSST